MYIANFKGTKMKLTDAMKSYVEKKMAVIEKHLVNIGEPQRAFVELEKTTHHHKTGPYFRCEVMLTLPGKSLRAEAEHEDLYAAIDLVKDALDRQVKDYKEIRRRM